MIGFKNKNHLKSTVRAVLLLVVLSLQGSFIEDGVVKTVKPSLQPVMGSIKNYVKDAHIEPVIFYSQKEDGSEQTIARHGQLKIIKDAPATILVCHGYMCDKNDIGFLRTMFAGYNIMTFDFRAHGERTPDQYCTFGRNEALDVIGAVRYLRSRVETAHKPLIAYGFSMGAVSAIEAQARAGDLFNAMVLDCPFASTDKIVDMAINRLKINLFGYEVSMPGREFLRKYAYTPTVQNVLKVAFKAVAQLDGFAINTYMHQTSPVESIEKIKVPCYFITCKNDEKVPVEDVTSIYAGAQGYKRLWITNGRRHYDSIFYNPEKYLYKVNKFIAKVINGKLSATMLEKVTQDPV